MCKKLSPNHRICGCLCLNIAENTLLVPIIRWRGRGFVSTGLS